jgi:hypothetical protein
MPAFYAPYAHPFLSLFFLSRVQRANLYNLISINHLQ